MNDGNIPEVSEFGSVDPVEKRQLRPCVAGFLALQHY